MRVTSDNWRLNWVSEKCEIATRLSRGEAGGTYSEATILVCAALSALSAEVWPFDRIDRKRFIELLVRIAPLTSNAATVSVPLLVQHLIAQGDLKNATALEKERLSMSPTRVVAGPEVDLSEREIQEICPTLNFAMIRRHSYACLLYEDVRSSYAHEYRSGSRADSWAMTQFEGQAASYVNRLLQPGIPEVGRFIHFHIEWLHKLAVDVASNIDAIAPTIPRVAPTTWWIEGAS